MCICQRWQRVCGEGERRLFHSTKSFFIRVLVSLFIWWRHTRSGWFECPTSKRFYRSNRKCSQVSLSRVHVDHRSGFVVTLSHQCPNSGNDFLGVDFWPKRQFSRSPPRALRNTGGGRIPRPHPPTITHISTQLGSGNGFLQLYATWRPMFSPPVPSPTYPPILGGVRSTGHHPCVLAEGTW